VKRGKRSDIHVNPAPGTEIKSPHVSRATSSISARQGAPDGDVAEATQRATRDAKRAIRADIRATMRAMHPHRRSFKSQAACEFVVRAPPLAGRGLLLAYRALGDEICVDAAVATLASRGWRVAFPSIDARGNMQLLEISINASMPDPFQAEHWTLDRHAIRAPHFDRRTARWVRARDIDAVLVPARAFDRAGHRLGRGQGHYDRLLAGLRPDARAATVGVACAEQIVAAVPVDPHDRPVAWIVTDRGVFRCRQS
jgi:5-formyltetrahydrofolate cyclo-ligase